VGAQQRGLYFLARAGYYNGAARYAAAEAARNPRHPASSALDSSLNHPGEHPVLSTDR